MTISDMILSEISSRGHAALRRELGVVGYIRFWQQYVGGRGDYTKDRRKWIGKMTLEEIEQRIAQQGKHAPATGTRNEEAEVAVSPRPLQEASMNGFESIIAMLARREHYWTAPSFKIHLRPSEKAKIGRPSCPRWEFDIVAYKPTSNDALVIECKSFLNSNGVRIANGKLMREKTYKLFNDRTTRRIVLRALRRHSDSQRDVQAIAGDSACPRGWQNSPRITI